jgi:PTH1 family peptidyl-tRNA hydrolase
MLLVVGLGNPGLQYEQTRHNVGFDILSSLADFFKVDFINKSKLNSEIAIASLGDLKIVLAKPLTYMNLSGVAVESIKNYYKISLQNVIIIHDEIDINPGRLKFKIGGGSAGHNGIKSIDNFLGNEYFRIRVGVGKPPKEIPISNWVLEKFSKEEKTIMNEVTKIIIDNFQNIIKKDIVELNKICGN